MRRFRRLATIALVWATASATLLASTPYYVCHCPDGTVKTHVVISVAPESSCCSSNCCAGGAKEKSCCQAAKKKQPAKPASETPAEPTRPQDSDGRPSISQVPCQKTLVQPEQRAACRIEIRAETDAAVTMLPAELPGLPCLFSVSCDRPLWRIDKAPPPGDLVTVLQRLTI